MPHSLKPRDAMIVTANPSFQEIIAAILDEEGHSSFPCSSLSHCNMALRSGTAINIVVMVIDDPEPLRPLLRIREMLLPLGQLPVFIVVPIWPIVPELELKIRNHAYLAFDFPIRIKDFVRKIEIANHIISLRGRGARVEIEHDCLSPVVCGCTTGAEPTSIMITDLMQRSHLLPAAFVPTLLGDFIFRNTSELRPARLDKILTDIFLSDFHMYWLREEHITRRWLITNFSRLTDAIEKVCEDSDGALSFNSILASETRDGKTTVYYSRVPWHLSHKKSGPE